MKNLGFWSKRKSTVKRPFSAISPFAKTFLEIAKEASSVLQSIIYSLIENSIPNLNPYGLLCAGLLLLITVHSLNALLTK